MKMFIPASCDIEFLSSNMQIEANNAWYDIKLKNHNFETQVDRNDQESNVEDGVDKSVSINENP